MPERPDLDYIVPRLSRELVGAEVAAVRAPRPVVLRVLSPAPVDAILSGASIRAIVRRAHFVVLESDRVAIAIAPMLAGRFAVAAEGARAPADLAFALTFRDGRELRYRDEVQMGKVYVFARGDRDKVPGLLDVGLDVLDPAVFTREAFRALARTRRDQVKLFLMDKAALDAMGNAYADEVLFEAGIHPKTFVRSLSDAELDRLHDAIAKVLGEATQIIAERAPPLDEKLRDFLKVRGRPGAPCVRCGTKLRRAGVRGHDAIFCPMCQPDVRKSAIVDWRRVPPGH